MHPLVEESILKLFTCTIKLVLTSVPASHPKLQPVLRYGQLCELGAVNYVCDPCEAISAGLSWQQPQVNFVSEGCQVIAGVVNHVLESDVGLPRPLKLQISSCASREAIRGDLRKSR
jgi:hypothetical protein